MMNGERLFARMDRAGPLLEGGEHSWGEAGEPAEILLKAHTRAEEEGLPVAVKLEDGAEWNPDCGTLEP